MAIIGRIDGLSIYDNKEEALGWARRNGLTGYHIHIVGGKTGYMGGNDHSKAVKKQAQLPKPPSPPTPPPPITVQPTPTPIPTPTPTSEQSDIY